MSRLFIIMIATSLALFAFKNHKIEPDFVQDGDYMGIKILDSKVLTLGKVDGLKFAEISDIAYDAKKDILYALSDKAKLFKLKIGIKDKKIVSVKALSGVKLRNLHDKKLLKNYKDSEGLALMPTGDKNALLISFERKPRVILYDDKIVAQKKMTIPKYLQDIHHYRGKNKALEALTYNEHDGIITAGEYPLRGEKKGYHDIYNSRGKLCAIKQTSPTNAITEMEMMPDGNLLVLQRKFELMHFSFETTLLKVSPKRQKNGVCQSKILAWMSTKEGWDIDNYEGLTHIKDNLYMMISDNNSNRFEKTILTLFEIKE